MHHITLQSPDLEQTVDRLEEEGVPVNSNYRLSLNDLVPTDQQEQENCGRQHDAHCRYIPNRKI